MREFSLGSSIFIGAIKSVDADFYALRFPVRSLFPSLFFRVNSVGNLSTDSKNFQLVESFEKFQATGHGELLCHVVTTTRVTRRVFETCASNETKNYAGL